MADLLMEFSSWTQPELSRVEFVFNRRQSISLRSKTHGKSFAWTKGVQALCQLLLEYASSENAKIFGEHGSIAASLDYAISKTPEWLAQMFGDDYGGTPLSKRLFRRINPERKLPGPVTIFVNSNLLKQSDLKIVVQGKILKKEELLDLQQILRNNYLTENNLLDLRIFGEQRESIVACFEEEVSTTLLADDIFSQAGMSSSIKRIRKNQVFADLVGENHPILAPEQFKYSAAELFGLADSELSISRILREEVINISLSHALPGSLALLKYLTDVKGYNFRINFNIASSVDTTAAILNNSFFDPPDLCAVGLAAGAVLMSKKSEYSPLMLMPRGSHKIVAAKNSISAKTRLVGRMALMQDEAASALYHLLDLRDRGSVNSRLKIENQGFDYVFNSLKNGDPELSAIVTFPHYQFNRLFNNAGFVELPRGLSNKESFLFLHNRIAKNPSKKRAISLAFRDAWWMLKNNPKLRQRMTKAVLADPAYITALSRFSGLTSAKRYNLKV